MFFCAAAGRGQSAFFFRDATIRITRSRLVAARAAIVISATRIPNICSAVCSARIVLRRPDMVVIIVSGEMVYDSTAVIASNGTGG